MKIFSCFGFAFLQLICEENDSLLQTMLNIYIHTTCQYFHNHASPSM